jgi:multiple sugar transport system substrate-binding protein
MERRHIRGRTARWTVPIAAMTAAALGLAGCAPSAGGAGGEDSAADLKGQVITIGVESGSPWQTFYSEVAPAFTKETGVDVKFLPVPHDSMQQQFLSDAVSGSGAYDVFTVDQTWMPQFASKGYLADLDSTLSAADRGDFLQNTLDTGTYDGKLYSVPFMVHNLVLYYRTDLFAAAGITEPPQTWDQYREYAKKLTDPATGVYGTIIPGAQDVEVSTRLESYIQQAGGDIVDAKGAPTLDSGAAKKALEMMTAVQLEDKSSPAGLHDLTGIQGQFLAGKVAMAFVWPYLYGMTQDPNQSQVVGNVGVALNPGSPDQVATTFSWGFGVNSASQKSVAAKKWVSWATSTEILEQLSLAQSVPVPRTTVSDAIAQEDSLDEGQKHAFAVFNESVARSTTMPMTPAFPQYQMAMSIAASSVMSGTQNIKDALSQAQQAAESAYESTK